MPAFLQIALYQGAERENVRVGFPGRPGAHVRGCPSPERHFAGRSVETLLDERAGTLRPESFASLCQFFGVPRARALQRAAASARRTVVRGTLSAAAI